MYRGCAETVLYGYKRELYHQNLNVDMFAELRGAVPYRGPVEQISVMTYILRWGSSPPFQLMTVALKVKVPSKRGRNTALHAHLPSTGTAALNCCRHQLVTAQGWKTRSDHKVAS